MAAAAFVLVLGLLAARTLSKLNLPGRPDVEHWGLADFRDNAYYPTVAFLHGENPYDAATYTPRYPVRYPFPPYAPLTLAIHAPFAVLPFEAAELAYWLVTAALALPLAGLALAACGVRTDAARVIAVAAALLLSRPGHWNLVLGQTAMLLVVATQGVLHYRRTRPGLAALCLAVTTLKPTFGVPLALLVLALGGVRVVLGAAALAGAVSLVVGVRLAAAAGGARALVASMLETARAFAVKVDVAAAGDGFRVDVIGSVGRLTGREWGGVVEGTTSAALLALGALAVARAGRGRRDEARIAPSLVCLTLLMCVYHNAYDALLVVLPLTAALTARQSNPWAHHPWLHGVLVACLTVPLVNYLASGTGLGILGVDSGTALWVAIMSVNGVALALAFTILIAAAWRGDGPAGGDERIAAVGRGAT